VAPDTRRVTERDVPPVDLVQRPHLLQQLVVRAVVELVVRRGNEQQCLRIGGELVAAAARTLQAVEQPGDAIQVRIGTAFVPHLQRQQGEEVQKVVVEENRERRHVARLFSSPIDQEIENV